MRKLIKNVLPILFLLVGALSLVMWGVNLDKSTPRHLTVFVKNDVMYIDINRLEISFAMSEEIVIFPNFKDMKEYISQLTAEECR